jgi:hypothetical protein
MRNMTKLFALSVLSALYALLPDKHVAAATCWKCDLGTYWENCPGAADCTCNTYPGQTQCAVDYTFCNGNGQPPSGRSSCGGGGDNPCVLGPYSCYS